MIPSSRLTAKASLRCEVMFLSKDEKVVEAAVCAETGVRFVAIRPTAHSAEALVAPNAQKSNT